MGINLLPWREQRQLHHGYKVLGGLAIASLMVMAGVILYFIYLRQEYKQLEQYNQQIQQNIKALSVLDAKTQQAHYQQALATIHLIQGIRHHQIMLLSMWQLLAQMLPSGLRLTQLQITQQHLLIQGETLRSQLIMSMIAELERSHHFNHLLLRHMGQDQAPSNESAPKTVTQFTLTADFVG